MFITIIIIRAAEHAADGEPDLARPLGGGDGP